MISALEAEHYQTLAFPTETLEKSENYLFTDLPLYFDPQRGNLPILGELKDNIFVVANAGAQLMNSPIFLEHNALTRENSIYSAPSMLCFTRPGDVFVYETDNERQSNLALTQIRLSFQKIGIDLTSVYMSVSETSTFIERYGGRVSILSSVIEPSLLTKYPDQGLRAMSMVAAYTKDGAQRLWQKQSIPTPITHYAMLNGQDSQEMAQIASNEFADYTDVVVNRVDGCGGYGIVFSTKDNLEQALSLEDFHNRKVQLQGRLPFVVSPGLVANIDKYGNVEIQLVSTQLFAKPGEHGGNLWLRNFDFREYDPDFYKTNLAALEALAYVGIIGQVSVDSIVISKEDSLKYNIAQTTMREANIRPGGSSPINRLKTGTINEGTIDGIITSTNVKVSENSFYYGEFANHLASLDTDRYKYIIYNYGNNSHGEQVAAVAVTGSNATRSELVEMKGRI